MTLLVGILVSQKGVWVCGKCFLMPSCSWFCNVLAVGAQQTLYQPIDTLPILSLHFSLVSNFVFIVYTKYDCSNSLFPHM